MQVPSHTVYLAFGANLGDRAATLRAARDRLPPAVVVVRCSSLYESLPWGVTDQPVFLNAVCEARTDLQPLELLRYLKTIEAELGRTAAPRWGPRAIDLDILFYDDMTLHTAELSIPHRYLHERAFVLVPLNEIAPAHMHPQLQVSISDLIDAEADEVRVIAGPDWREPGTETNML